MSAYNGLGPWWFPAWLRRYLTARFARAYNEASVRRHDASYAAGHPARAVCDRGFRRAMQRDAARAQSDGRAFVLDLVAWGLWLILRLFGWASYNRNGR